MATVQQSAENSPPSLELREREWLIATGKVLTLQRAIALLGLDPEMVEQFEPEQGRENFPAEAEPQSKNPVEAVAFKIRRALEFYKDQAESLTILAGDVVAEVIPEGATEGEFFHRFVRDGADVQSLTEQQKQAHYVELHRRYCEDPFTMRWHLGFGISENGSTRYGKMMIEAEFPPLYFDDVLKSYNPLTSPGVDFIALQKDYSGIHFIAKTDQKDAGIEVSPALAEQLIVSKVPSVEMINQLLEAEIEQNPEVYSQVLFSLAA